MREEKRELYREGTPENLKKGYTDLVYGGSGVEVEKGVISAPGSGGGGGYFIVNVTGEYSSELDETIYTSDTEYSAIVDKFNDGILVIVQMDDCWYYPSHINTEFDNYKFSYINMFNTEFGIQLSYETISIGEEDSATVVYYVPVYATIVNPEA